MSYSFFAKFYDSLTENVNYKKRADYFSMVFKTYGESPKLILDLACGTGSLSIELAKLGYEVIATDSSVEMLTEASAKIKRGNNLTLIEQSMIDLDLPCKVDGAVCTLDSLNHLDSESDLSLVFERLSLNIKPGGIFVFDVNTEYKHSEVLGSNCFIFENEEVFCTWQNDYVPDNKSVNILLDFFVEQNNGSYLRESEDFTEQFFSYETIKENLEKSKFEILNVFGEDSFENPKDTEQRLIYITRRNYEGDFN